MFKRVAPYIGEYRKYTILAVIFMAVGIVANVAPYFFLYQIIAPLSGGEQQRISIARCILKDSPIVILDEATASVDADNERAIQEAISELCRDKTLLVIAHRLRTIRDADQILVIADGQIRESGTHDSLMAAHGAYAHLVELQMS